MSVLNPRELKFVKFICSEKSNSDIAEKLKLSLRQTEKIKTVIYHKTKTSSNVGLLKWAVRNKHYVIK